MPFSLSQPSENQLTRRRLLAGSATLGAAGTLGSVLPVNAFAFADPQPAIMNPCIGIHAEAGETLAGIAGDPGIAPELKARVAMTSSCPHCGTRLAATSRNV